MNGGTKTAQPAISRVLEDRDGWIWAGSGAASASIIRTRTNPPKTLPGELSWPAFTEEPVTVVFHAVDKWRYTPAERLLFSYV